MKRNTNNGISFISKRPKRQCVINNEPNPYPYILTIIDMQPTFFTSNYQPVKDAVEDLILKAIDDGAYIIIAHFMKYGKTHNNLLNLVRNYKDRSLVYANKNDKSDAIMTKILKKQIRTSFIKVCGVNTDACVQATVTGLSKTLPDFQIEIIKNACNSYSQYDHNFGINEMALLNNVIIQ